MNLKKLFLFIYLLISSLLTCSAQEKIDNTPYFLLSGKISAQSSSAGNIRMTLSDNKETMQPYTLNKSGKYELQLPYNKKLTLTIQKEGFYTKIIAIDTHIPNSVWQQNMSFPALTVNFQMIERSNLIANNFENLPIAHIAYSSGIDNIDISYTITDKELKTQIAEAKSEQKSLNSELADANAQDDLTSLSKDEQYKQLIDEANLAYNRSAYTEAIESYQKAHQLLPENSFPIDRIAEIEMIMFMLAKQQAIDDKYKLIIAKADDSFKVKQYAEAIALYQEALIVKPNDDYANKQIEESSKFISKQEIQTQYLELIAIGDSAFLNENFDDAKQAYKQATSLKHEEEYPYKKLAEINALENEQMRLDNLEKSYLSALNDGDLLFNNQSYEDAISLYKKALEYKADDVVVKRKITEVRQAIKYREENAAYAAIIVRADQAFLDKNFQLAEKMYNKANALLPNDSHTISRLGELYEFKRFDALIAEGNALFKKKEWNEAKHIYLQASTIRNESFIHEQVAKIDGHLATLANDEQYTLFIKAADQAFREENYILALQKYNDARNIKPQEEYPQTQIDEISIALAQMEEAKQQESIFTEIMQEGKNFEVKQNYNNALSSYEEALKLKPANAEVLDRINTVKEKIEQLNIRKEYNELITKADQTFEDRNYTLAEQYYNQASSLMFGELYPKKQLDKINQIKETQHQARLQSSYDSIIIIADNSFKNSHFTPAEKKYQEALQIFSDKAYPKKQLEKIQEIRLSVKEADKQAYQECVTKADNQFHQKSYALAKYYYNEALKYIAWEEYPQAQLVHISSLSNISLSKTKQAEHQRLLKEANDAYNKKDYAVARTLYYQALQLKQDDDKSALRIISIEQIIEQSQSAKQNEIYRNIITKADQAYVKKQYSIARSYYNQALNIKSGDKYVKNQLRKIHDIVNND
ncbi:MAG: hypothetical protein ACK5MI_01135 [Mangrovibacterium sp.]